MSKEISGTEKVFDLDRLRELIEMMEKHGVTEVNLRHGTESWKLRRGPREVQTVVSQASYMPAPAVATGSSQVTAAGTPAAKPAAADLGRTINSPTVGTFYAAATPEDPPFVSAGSKVTKDTIVCIVEAMKVFNQIPAEVNGTITEVLLNNGDPVEFGQPLFRVTPG